MGWSGLLAVHLIKDDTAFRFIFGRLPDASATPTWLAAEEKLLSFALLQLGKESFPSSPNGRNDYIFIIVSGSISADHAKNVFPVALDYR